MTKSIIVAIDENGAIGKDNDLLCYLPADLKHFKEITTNHTIVMGRRTFESLPKGALPNRVNVVLTKDESLSYEGCIMCNSINDIWNKVEEESRELFFIGGASIYKLALPIVDKLYLTKIHHSFKGADTFFPEIDYSQWKLIEEERHDKNEKNEYEYTFSTYIRR